MIAWFMRFWYGLYIQVEWGFRRGSTVPSEIFSAAILLWFAVAIGRPDPLEIDVLTLSPLDDVIPVRVLAVVLASVQVARLIGIGMQQSRVRLLCSLFSVFWWTMFAVGFTTEFPGPNLRLGAGLLLALLQAWVAIRMTARNEPDHEWVRRLVRGTGGERTD